MPRSTPSRSGFVFSMMLAHAPVILPALARVKLLFGWLFYVPLGVAPRLPRRPADRRPHRPLAAGCRRSRRTPFPSCCSRHRRRLSHCLASRSTRLRRVSLTMATILLPIEEPPRPVAAPVRAVGPGLSPVLLPRQRLRGAVDPALGAAVLRHPRSHLSRRAAVACARDGVRVHAGRHRRLPLHRRAELEQPADAHRLEAGSARRALGRRPGAGADAVCRAQPRSSTSRFPACWRPSPLRSRS